jgi:hypothetical protein
MRYDVRPNLPLHSIEIPVSIFKEKLTAGGVLI